MKADISHNTRNLITFLALGINILLAAGSTIFTVLLVKVVIMKHWIAMGFTAAAFGVATILLFCEAGDVLRKTRTGRMPIAMSSRRPLIWAAIVAVAIGMMLGIVALVIWPR